MRRIAGTVAGLTAVAGVALAPSVLISPASAASCSVVSIAAASSLVKLNVSSVTVTVGGCVAFANKTVFPVQVTVPGTSYSATVPPNSTTSGSSNFIVTKTVTVNATSGLRSGSGTITARAPSPSPSRSATPSPRPSQSATPTVSPRPTASHHRRTHPGSPPAKISLPPLPPLPIDGRTATPRGTNPLVAPGTTSAPAITPTPSASHPTAAATVVEPVGGARRGLPELIAGVLVLGLLAAFGRVVLGYRPAVDDRPDRDHRA